MGLVKVCQEGVQLEAGEGALAQQGADLDPETRQCRPGRVCSHYQQLVAPSAREVGCARLVCPALDQVWICQYRLG